MGCLTLALIFQFTIHRKILKSESTSPAFAKFTGIASMLLWLGVGLGGRAIAFV
jgi:hypothetical protein